MQSQSGSFYSPNCFRIVAISLAYSEFAKRLCSPGWCVQGEALLDGKIVGFAQLAQTAATLCEGGAVRRFVAIAGAPGSGKSTTAEALCDWLNARSEGCAALLPMDGFHYDDAVLHAMGRRPFKGAPDTFDVGGLKSVLQRLADPKEGPVAVPVFDRTLEISRGSARIIPPEVQLVIVEGNYLLLDTAPWRMLASFFDLSVMIDVSEPVLRHRLRERWEGYGLNAVQIAHKLDGNDLPNGRLVCAQSRPADLTLRQD